MSLEGVPQNHFPPKEGEIIQQAVNPSMEDRPRMSPEAYLAYVSRLPEVKEPQPASPVALPELEGNRELPKFEPIDPRANLSIVVGRMQETDELIRPDIPTQYPLYDEKLHPASKPSDPII